MYHDPDNAWLRSGEKKSERLIIYHIGEDPDGKFERS
jgi:hypothetical protein